MSEKTEQINPGRLFFAIILFTLHLVMLIRCLKFPLVAKMFPLIVLIPLLILLTIEVLKDIWIMSKGSDVLVTIQENLSSGIQDEIRGHVWVLFLLLSCYIFGLILTTALFPLIFMLSQKEKWTSIIAVSLGLCGGIYLLFIKILKIPLYEGLLLELILS